MASFSDLPSEIVQDIILHVLLDDQSAPPSLENFRYDEQNL
jgi:hypothetical protein